MAQPGAPAVSPGSDPQGGASCRLLPENPEATIQLESVSPLWWAPGLRAPRSSYLGRTGGQGGRLLCRIG